MACSCLSINHHNAFTDTWIMENQTFGDGDDAKKEINNTRYITMYLYV